MSEEKGQQWADPGFIGLMALAAAVASLWPILTGIVPPSAVPAVIGWMFVSSIALVICGIICLRIGNAVVGAPCIVFGTIINFGTVFAFLLPLWGMSVKIPIDGTPINGWVFLVIGFLSVAMGWPFGKVSWLMWAWMMDLALVFWIAGLGFLGMGPAWVVTGGWLLFVFDVVCLYIAIAGHINTTFGAPKLPLGKPIF
jgi:succinate-acetate transporter protein